MANRWFYYTLDGRVPVPATRQECEALLGNWLRRNVAQYRQEEFSVSTMFLCLDHQMWGDGPPLVFETMVFGGSEDEYQERYSTWEDALAGHNETVRRCRLAAGMDEGEE